MKAHKHRKAITVPLVVSLDCPRAVLTVAKINIQIGRARITCQDCPATAEILDEQRTEAHSYQSAGVDDYGDHERVVDSDTREEHRGVGEYEKGTTNWCANDDRSGDQCSADRASVKNFRPGRSRADTLLEPNSRSNTVDEGTDLLRFGIFCIQSGERLACFFFSFLGQKPSRGLRKHHDATPVDQCNGDLAHDRSLPRPIVGDFWMSQGISVRQRKFQSQLRHCKR